MLTWLYGQAKSKDLGPIPSVVPHVEFVKDEAGCHLFPPWRYPRLVAERALPAGLPTPP